MGFYDKIARVRYEAISDLKVQFDEEQLTAGQFIDEITKVING